MYILLLDGLVPKLVTCTSEAALAAGATIMAAVTHPAAASVAAPAASSARIHLFIVDPHLSEIFRRQKSFRTFSVLFHCRRLLIGKAEIRGCARCDFRHITQWI